MFYCREEELRTMNRLYKRGRFECIVIYGRRRVGKTTLINEFCKGKPTIYFSALNASSQENLEALSQAIYTFQNPDSSMNILISQKPRSLFRRDSSTSLITNGSQANSI